LVRQQFFIYPWLRSPNIMRRSREVPLTLLASLALSLTACEQRDCVDGQGRKLPDSACHTGAAGGVAGAHFIYGGRSGGHIGDTVIGGGVSRGGFGGIGGSHAGGGE
jgi:hypothetical protein